MAALSEEMTVDIAAMELGDLDLLMLLSADADGVAPTEPAALAAHNAAQGKKVAENWPMLRAMIDRVVTYPGGTKKIPATEVMTVIGRISKALSEASNPKG